MTRSMNASMVVAIGAEKSTEVQFIELQFSDLTTRICTAARDVVWNGFTWEAIGGHLEIEAFTESTESDSNGMRLTLSGVDQSILAQVLGSNFRGRPGKVWYGHIGNDGAIVGGNAGPILMFDGRMNESWEINETRTDFGAGTVAIATKLAARISEFAKVRGIRTNVTSHQGCGIAGVTTDTFFRHTGALAGQKIYWGSLAPGQQAPPNPGGSSGPITQGGPVGSGPTQNGGSMPWGSNPGGPWGNVPMPWGPSTPNPGNPTMDPGQKP